MQNLFELYLKTNKTTPEDWQRFYTIITQHIGSLNKIHFYIVSQDTVVRYFVASDSDLGLLSNNIELGVLRPVDASELEIPNATSKERLVRFVTGGNVLDLAEKIGVKRAKKLRMLEVKVRKINTTKALCNLNLYFESAAGVVSKSRKASGTFPAHLFAVDFDENARYQKKSISNYLSLEKTVQLLEPADVNALFSVNTFPYFARDYYLPLHSYEFDKHSFIIGASGSGKSKFIQLYIDRLARTQAKMNYRIIVIDPHDSLRKDLATIPESKIINFADESTELFGSDDRTDVSASTELTTSLMKSLIGDDVGARLERVLRFSLYVLFVGQTMSLGYLKRFLTETELRNEILGHVDKHVPDNIRKFFATDFNDIRTSYYNEAILPIVALIDEMQLQPALVSESEQQLSELVQNNFLTVFSLNKVSMGERVVKTAAGLLIQQIFLLAQARAFNQKVILIIDEVSIVQNPALASILSEARKFNLSVILTQQYFGQVEKDLRDAIFANVYNYYTFRISEEDARGLVGNLVMEIPKEIMEVEVAKGLKEEQVRIQYMTNLNPRECLIRVSANGQILPCFKGRTLDIGSGPAQPTVLVEQLVDYQPAKTKRPQKFVEGTVEELPEFGATTNQTATEEPIVPDLPALNEVSGPYNPEADQSYFSNHEIDPVERHDKLQQRAQQYNKSVHYIVSLVVKTPASAHTGNSDIRPGLSLSELLASQSSNNDNSKE